MPFVGVARAKHGRAEVAAHVQFRVGPFERDAGQSCGGGLSTAHETHRRARSHAQNRSVR